MATELTYTCLQLDRPDWFKRADFRRWLFHDGTATWVNKLKAQVDDGADAFTTYDGGDGPDAPYEDGSGLPTDIWDEICRLCQELDINYCVVRITPMEE